MRFLSLRASFLLAFVVAMPVLALPPVARRIDEWLYGAPPTDFAQVPAASRPDEASEKGPASLVGPPPVAPEAVAPAHFLDTNTSSGTPAANHIRQAATAAPLATLPAAAPFARPSGAPALAETKIDERTIVRLQQVRQRLEQLGAEYVVVEMLESTGRYRFHCRMLIDERSRFTRPFEASAADPIAAGEQVLREVETWRSGGAGAVTK